MGIKLEIAFYRTKPNEREFDGKNNEYSSISINIKIEENDNITIYKYNKDIERKIVWRNFLVIIKIFIQNLYLVL